MTRGEKVIAFIEEYCRVPEGRLVGQKIVLEDFQKKFILAVYDNPAGTWRAILSIARKNGKTALIAGICLAHIVGPEALLNSQIISGARSRDQASLVFKLACKMIALEPRLKAVTKIVPSGKQIFGLLMNVEYSAISAEARTAHGLSPVLAILDELGQVRGPRDDFVDAIETSQGAHEGPLLIVISTQAASDADMLSMWIDDAIKNADPKVVCHVYASDKDCDILDEAQWAKSNPALGVFRSRDDMRILARKARNMPSFESTFRNLNLNQRIDVNNLFVGRDIWDKNNGKPEPLGRKVLYGGLDLSSVSDLTALVLASQDGDVHCWFWMPEEGLDEKARAARTPFDLWAKDGYIETPPGYSIQYAFIARRLRALFDEYVIAAIAFDRYNMRFLKPWLEHEGFNEEELERFVDFGQGFAGMSPALRELECRLLEGQIKHGANPVLRHCAASAVTVSDPAGNRKFAKNKSSGKIDGMVALAMAVGVMPTADQGDFEGFLSSPVRGRY